MLKVFLKNVNRQKAGKLMWANIYIKKPKLYDYCYYTWTQWDNFISQIVHLNCYEKMSWDAETFFLVHYTFLFIIRKNMPSVKFKFFYQAYNYCKFVTGGQKLNLRIVNVFVTKKSMVIKSFPLFIFQA